MKNYYYAGGRKIGLEPDDEHVAVDRAVAEAAGLSSSAITIGMPDLRSGVVLWRKSSLGTKILQELHKAGALRPVFRHDRDVIVVLPEVRVEYDNISQRKAVKKVLASTFDNVSISEETDDRLIFKPRSGDARDALKMANNIFEEAHPAASSVRFVHFLPKPGVKPITRRRG